jgi:uncharacterized membrane protein YdcZ (DUF606 family)
MRVLLVLVIVLVFGALLLLDTAGLLRLAAYCATGGCGVAPAWLAFGVGLACLAVYLSSRRPRVQAAAPRKRAPSAKRTPTAKRKPAAGGRRAKPRAAASRARPAAD